MPEVIDALRPLGYVEWQTRHAIERCLEEGRLKLCSNLHVCAPTEPDVCNQKPRCRCGKDLP